MRPDKPDKPDKKDFFVARLETGSAFLHLDARRPGVLVPPSFGGASQLVLQYGYALKIPIPDLVVNEWGVRATLSFSRSPFRTAVPWSAVYGIHGEDGVSMIWEEDVPPELRQGAVQAETSDTPSHEVTGKRRGHLKLVQ